MFLMHLLHVIPGFEKSANVLPMEILWNILKLPTFQDTILLMYSGSILFNDI